MCAFEGDSTAEKLGIDKKKGSEKNRVRDGG